MLRTDLLETHKQLVCEPTATAELPTSDSDLWGQDPREKRDSDWSQGRPRAERAFGVLLAHSKAKWMWCVHTVEHASAGPHRNCSAPLSQMTLTNVMLCEEKPGTKQQSVCARRKATSRPLGSGPGDPGGWCCSQIRQGQSRHTVRGPPSWTT